MKKLAARYAPPFIRDIYVKYYKNNELTNRFANILSLDILVKGGMFFFYPIYIRLMSVDEYGIYGYLINIISVFAQCLNFGLYLAQSKQFHDIHKSQRGSYIFTINAFLLFVLAPLLSLLFYTRTDTYLIHFLFENPISYDAYRPWILLGILNSIYSLMVYNYFMTSEQIRYYQVQNVLKLVFVNLVVVYFMKMDIGDNVLVRIKYNFIAETIILLPFLYIYLRHIRLRINLRYLKDALYIGVPAMLSSIIGIFYSLADRKFIEQYRSHEELGIYTLGITLSGIIYLIFAAFQSSLLPFFFKEKDKKANYERTIRAIKKIAMLLTGISALMFLVTLGLIQFRIIKPEYVAVLPVMPFMLLTQIIQAVSSLFANYFVYFNKNYYSIFLSVLSAVLNIVLCMLFIPSFGMAGAVASTFIATLALCFINFNFARNHCLNK